MDARFLAAAFVMALAAGCFGLPEGSADTGDTVTIRYSAYDAATGEQLRNNRTATFALGSGDSGLGLAVERAVRGHAANETFTVEVSDDPSLAFTGLVAKERVLPPIEVHQSAPRTDFDRSQWGPATVGKAFTAYGIYPAVVTAVSNSTVQYDVNARDGQVDSFEASIGATVTSNVRGDEIVRTLNPVTGATFVVAPPTQFNPRTPLGLDPGSYRTAGANETHIHYTFLDSPNGDLLGKPVRYTITVLRVTEATTVAGPQDGDYGRHPSPYVNGDPDSVLGSPTHDDDHAH